MTNKRTTSFSPIFKVPVCDRNKSVASSFASIKICTSYKKWLSDKIEAEPGEICKFIHFDQSRKFAHVEKESCQGWIPISDFKPLTILRQPKEVKNKIVPLRLQQKYRPVSYTHLRAHET